MIVSSNVNAAQTSRPFVLPAPIGGLNGRDPLADMPPQDAYYMDNLFPQANSVVARRGCQKHINTPLDGAPETLAVYTGAGTEKMLAWAGTKIYDVSTSTPVEIDNAITEPYAITAMFSNAADNAQFLIAVNGSNLPKSFNGTVMADLTMTGIPSPQDLNFVFTFKNRLFFGARDRLGFFYLPVGQIQGGLAYFDLAQVSKLGGRLQAIASYSEMSGETPNDYIIFITSRGECIVFAGNDPSNANAWSLVGRYYCATPIGQRCTFNLNGELILLTLEGAIPFSEVRKSGNAQAGGVGTNQFGAITTKLGRFLSELNPNAHVLGWEAVQYSRAGWLLLNAPATSTQSGNYFHYVMNVNTGAWTRFVNWNGISWAVFNDNLYFGRFDGYILQADVGGTDDGEDIDISVKQAYNYFNGGENDIGNRIKKFQWAQLFIASDGTPPVSGSFSVNFLEQQPDFLTGIADPEGADWDFATWDVSSWASGNEQRTLIITLNRGGFNGSLWLRSSLRNVTFEWFATQYVMEPTSGLLI